MNPILPCQALYMGATRNSPIRADIATLQSDSSIINLK